MATVRRATPRERFGAWASDPAVVAAWRAFAVSRAVVWACGVAAVLVWGLHDANALKFDAEGLTRPFGHTGDDLVAPGARWDSAWFERIADAGYAPDASRAAFFPLYPLLVRVGGAAVGSPVVAGIVISLACLFGALVVLHRLVALDFGRDVAALTVLLVALFPGAMWFSSVYSEALFLLLSVACVYGARTDRWVLAGIAGALAASTRSAGVVLLVPLAVLWWHGRRRPVDLAWTLLVPLGVAAFCVGIVLTTSYAFSAPFDAQADWLRNFAGPFGAVPPAVSSGISAIGDIVSGAPRPHEPFDPAWQNAWMLVTFAGVVVAFAGAVRRLPAAYWLYALAALALPLSYPVDGLALMSFPRFVAVIWPLHLWLAVVLVRRTRTRRVIVALSITGLAVVSARVAMWDWVA